MDWIHATKFMMPRLGYGELFLIYGNSYVILKENEDLDEVDLVYVDFYQIRRGIDCYNETKSFSLANAFIISINCACCADSPSDFHKKELKKIGINQNNLSDFVRKEDFTYSIDDIEEWIQLDDISKDANGN